MIGGFLYAKKRNEIEKEWYKACEVPATREMCCVRFAWIADKQVRTEYGTARHYEDCWLFTLRIPKGAWVVSWQYMTSLSEEFRAFIVPLPLEKNREKKKHKRFGVWFA